MSSHPSGIQIRLKNIMKYLSLVTPLLDELCDTFGSPLLKTVSTITLSLTAKAKITQYSSFPSHTLTHASKRTSKETKRTVFDSWNESTRSCAQLSTSTSCPIAGVSCRLQRWNILQVSQRLCKKYTHMWRLSRIQAESSTFFIRALPGRC
ncbi:hypothetical protein K438DRAFT_1292094 [Mycena galopus ATCC 62051]|nr:hypothetical protein K438DRAFT_1292094 [Mycena galopus ATCC 62051]